MKNKNICIYVHVYVFMYGPGSRPRPTIKKIKRLCRREENVFRKKAKNIKRGNMKPIQDRLKGDVYCVYFVYDLCIIRKKMKN